MSRAVIPSSPACTYLRGPSRIHLRSSNLIHDWTLIRDPTNPAFATRYGHSASGTQTTSDILSSSSDHHLYTLWDKPCVAICDRRSPRTYSTLALCSGDRSQLLRVLDVHVRTEVYPPLRPQWTPSSLAFNTRILLYVQVLSIWPRLDSTSDMPVLVDVGGSPHWRHSTSLHFSSPSRLVSGER